MRQELSTGNTNAGKRLFQSTINNEPEKKLSYNRSLIALASSWGGLIADLSLQIGNLSTVIEPLSQPPIVPGNNQWVQVIGHCSVGDFKIFMPSETAATFLQLSHQDLDISKLEGGDAALVFEHLLTDYIYKIEAILGTSFIIETVTDVAGPVDGELLGFEFKINGTPHTCALSLTGQLHEAVEHHVAPYSFIEEKLIDNKMLVHLGPVVLPSRQAYLARIGEMINCGVQPSDVIKGVLMRSDGKYYPINIEDERIEIIGELSDAVNFNDMNKDNVFVTFGLGEVSLTAYERSTIGKGTLINISRLPKNAVNIYYQMSPFGKGHLSILESNLAVTLDSVGAFVA